MQRDIEMAKIEPVKEADYRLKRNVKIGLFDCLMPRLRKLKKPKKRNNPDPDDSDLGDLEDLIDENDILKDKVAKLTKENDNLKEKVEQLIIEIDVVDWYTLVMEKGIVTKDVCIQLFQYKDLYRNRKKQYITIFIIIIHI